VNLSSFLSKKRLLSRPSLATIQFLLALCATCLSAVLFFSEPVMGGLLTVIIDMGLDPLRSQLLVALLLTGGAALVGAACGRSKAGAMVGAGITFWLGCLANFLQLEQRPAYDPGGTWSCSMKAL
jgi:hypothetical protein